MVFGTRNTVKKAKNVQLPVRGLPLQTVPTYKYLGITLDSALTLNYHVKNVTSMILYKNSILSLHKQGQVNWCNYVKDVLVEMEMIGAWDDQCITLKDINIINETLHTKFMNDTLADIANSTKFPKLRTYKLFKKDFRLENYLIEIENTKHALSLTRFRISSHNLRIETGRYDQRKIKPEERLCIYCRSQAVKMSNISY